MDTPTIESNSFGINLNGTFRTAAYGAEVLTADAAPAPNNAPKIG